MSLVQLERKFIYEQGTPAEEALSEFKEIIVKTEEESDDQSRQMDFTRTPQIILHRIDFLPLDGVKEEVLAKELLSNQQSTFSLDQEEPEAMRIKEDLKKELKHQDIKEEQDELAYNEVKEEQEKLAEHQLDQQEELVCLQIKEEQQELEHQQMEERGEVVSRQIKEEQEELKHQLIKEEQDSQEQVLVKLETDTFMVTSTSDEKYHTNLIENYLCLRTRLRLRNKITKETILNILDQTEMMG
ncbi:ras guanine nucleotide exchange factor R [Fundulus heteroclitus]|uniref:ras guanine nucleotide exchange factor R n=1 Tax=Fundulus heteroclitus TaxID=8078 RepID=UPI00165C61E1|nr:ras guanine nucleotide exchange factor R [Fundulus heteroclitus]